MSGVGKQQCCKKRKMLKAQHVLCGYVLFLPMSSLSRTPFLHSDNYLLSRPVRFSSYPYDNWSFHLYIPDLSFIHTFVVLLLPFSFFLLFWCYTGVFPVLRCRTTSSACFLVFCSLAFELGPLYTISGMFWSQQSPLILSKLFL